MKVAVLGDVGQPVYHVGDEAMTHAAVDELRARGINDIVVFTRSVADSRSAFDAEAAPTLAFPGPPQERSDYLWKVLAAAEGDRTVLPETDPVWEFMGELSQCDALLVAGGGNMNSLYGWLLYERVAAVRIAKLLGLSVVVSGQTLGPDLYGPDREAARTLLETADMVGAREASSLQLMQGLTPAAHLVRPCLDDASFFAAASPPAPANSCETTANRDEEVPVGPFIAATFSPGHGEVDRDTYLSTLAAVLDDASELTGYPVVFLPHMATPTGTAPAGKTCAGSATGSAEVATDTGQRKAQAFDVDEHMHHEIAARMESNCAVLLPIQSAYRTAELTRRSALVITSRYHPVVFALDAGIPVVALVPEGYSDARIRGALENWGLGNLALPLPSLFDGSLTRAITDIWAQRDALTSYLTDIRASRVSQHHQWWDNVVSVLQGGQVPDDQSAPTKALPLPVLDPLWQAQAASSALAFLPMSSALTALRLENEHLRGQYQTVRRERDHARDDLASWLGSKSFRLARKIAAAAALVRWSK
ncbi:polysaccharide pyruvyl transferase family protein [Arthrobacter burdickii]|uniref:Polysaccharide pyruvyl transferase family protein n=1 Tax=Arthrobacter burdickii TaxID=3035920 RepID=A0ABT8K578_9MICC|nr:polysaccharide pyruvyl transferase family protein [Arthrobacter burdickii]MDN4612615.1 polysaccharide pyruvyl transferase family protein [Arthrobacter burdickii]